jgi:hypothetical protein
MLNPGIVRLVQLLNDNGFETCDSGDGETHDFSCDRPYPYVCMKVVPSLAVKQAKKLHLLLQKQGLQVVSQTEAFSASESPSGPCIQLSYDPCDDIAILDLMGVKDSMLP